MYCPWWECIDEDGSMSCHWYDEDGSMSCHWYGEDGSMSCHWYMMMHSFFDDKMTHLSYHDW